MILFSLFIMQPVQSQKLLKKITKKVNQKAEERLEKKLDKEIDKGLDKLEDELDKNSAEESTEESVSSDNLRLQRMMNKIGISTTPVPINENYSFDHLIQMHIEEYDKKGNKTSEGEFITHLDSDSKCMAYQAIDGDMASKNQGLFILDIENEATIILSEENGEKKGIVYGIKGFMETMGESYEVEELEDTPEAYLANPNVKKTGRTKNIAGYKCEEFVYSDENSESNIWITQDLKMKTNDFFSTVFKTSVYSHGIPWGYMMETTTLEKSNGEKSTMQVTKVDTNSNTKFSIGDYQITNLGSFQPPAEE